MKKLYLRLTSLLLVPAIILSMTACGGKKGGTSAPDSANSSGDADTNTEIHVFIAASLSSVMEELASMYREKHPEVTISYNADSSGTLLQQIQEGFECDIFFSAAQKQMDALEADQLVMGGTRANVVNNQVCVVKAKNADTKVTGLETIGKAKSIALAGGSVPVGKYTRQAMVNLKLLPKTDDVSTITTAQVSDALGKAEISEQSNVSKVRTAVIEGSCEVGTVYYSDTCGFEDKLEIIQKVSYDLTGNVIYPICRVVNKEADQAQSEAARDFYQFILSDEASAVFDKYLFDTNIERS
ncbi:MAG: molybdate ABC transporter substrate-binding protein [Lachnospiraceae bacterium]|nr:molybdate ABC transporter substrate-binding protein [Lachnospiraceae bacterium]